MSEEKREVIIATETGGVVVDADPESVSCLSACYVLA
jgi:hypothetical protein